METMVYEPPTIRLGDIAENYRSQAVTGLRVRCRTLLNFHDGRILRGHTIHVNDSNLVITVPTELKQEQECAVFFAIEIAEHTFTIAGTGSVVRCTGNHAEGYRVHLRFVVEDKKSRIAMAQLFGNKPSNKIQ
jgi:hypothetical protein